jgi:hypothetical protein
MAQDVVGHESSDSHMESRHVMKKYFCSGQLKMPPKASGTNETNVNISTAKRISTTALPAPSPSQTMVKS